MVNDNFRKQISLKHCQICSDLGLLSDMEAYTERRDTMSKQIRGIILEGQSCSGKTSIFNAIKRCHPLETDA
jgi:hypothetical protein